MENCSRSSGASESSAPPAVETIRSLFGSPRPCVNPRAAGCDPQQVVRNPKIAIIDDQSLNIKVVQKYLKLAGYRQFVTTTDSRLGVSLVEGEDPDVLLLDIMMPCVSGLEILAAIRGRPAFADLPVIILTAAADKETKLEALRLGATEFLQKPVDPVELETRLRNVLLAKGRQDQLRRYAWELELEVAVRCAELAEAHREVVHCLATISEYRDNETGKHIIRVGRYAEIIARRLGLDEEFVGRIAEAAPLHDIGKIGIPDHLLLKPGKLECAEMELMKRHSEYGRRMCAVGTRESGPREISHTQLGRSMAAGGTSPLLRMAGGIAYTHHERWDGGGYPQGLKGEEIPLEGRITALADVFDALTSPRPYKPAFPLDESLEMVRQQRGKQFDPAVVDAFLAGLEEVLAVYNAFQDRPQDVAAPAWLPAGTEASFGRDESASSGR